MKKMTIVAALAVITVMAFAALSTVAYARPSFSSRCNSAGCHVGPNVVVTATVVATSGPNARLNLSAPGATAIAVFNGTTKVGTTFTGASAQTTVTAGNTYTIFGVMGPGRTTGVGLTTITPALNVPVPRLSSNNNYGTAVAAAKTQCTMAPSTTPTYTGVTNIVLASGDVRAQADPLAAAGMCWAYRSTRGNAPLLLVSARAKTDSRVLSLIDAIVAANASSTVTVRIVGGPGSVPNARYNEIAAYVATHSRGMIAKDRVINFGDRFDLAGAIAMRMKMRADASLTDSLVLPSQVLVANGADPNKFFDPLALSPIAAYRGAPILLVSVGRVPAATSRTIARLRAANANTRVYVGAGSGTVSESVRRSLRATRIWGPDRYSNATTIANYAFARGWLLNTAPAAVASTITHAQIAGAMVGGDGGALVLTRSTSLPSVTSSWLMSHMNTLPMVYVFGSTANLSESVRNSVVQAVN